MKHFVVFVLSMICGVSEFSDTLYVSTNDASNRLYAMKGCFA